MNFPPTTRVALAKDLPQESLRRGDIATIVEYYDEGHLTMRLANTTNITFHVIESEALFLLLDQAGICASSGSACLADSPDPSHVGAAMKPGSDARQCIRFSLGTMNTVKEVSQTILAIQGIAASLTEAR